MNLKKSAARVGSNFMISFFGSVTFDFVTDVPSENLVVGSVIFSGVMSMLSLGYELRRYAEGI